MRTDLEMEENSDWCFDRDSPSIWTRRRIKSEHPPVGTYVTRSGAVGGICVSGFGAPKSETLRLYKIESITYHENKEPLYNLREIEFPYKLKSNIIRYHFTPLSNNILRDIMRIGYVRVTRDMFGWLQRRRVYIRNSSVQEKMIGLVKKNETALQRQDRIHAKWHTYWRRTLNRCLRLCTFIENILEFSPQNEIVDVVIGVATMSRSCFNSVQWRRLISTRVSERTGGGGLASLKAVRVAVAASLKALNTADYALGFSLNVMKQIVKRWESKNSIGFTGSVIAGVRLWCHS